VDEPLHTCTSRGFQDMISSIDIGADKDFVLAPKAKLARCMNDSLATGDCLGDGLGIARVTESQLCAALAQEAVIAGGTDKRAHAMSALDEQWNEVMAQEAGRASDEDHFGLLIVDLRFEIQI